METLEELFEDHLEDIYYAEKVILQTLPQLSQKVQSRALSAAFSEHAEQTRGHIERLEQIFERLDKSPKTKRCAAMDGIKAEADELLKEVDNPSLLDAGLLAAAQAVEHYEIARYGTLKAWAEKMGDRDLVQLIDKTLEEEKATDKKLTMLAEKEINIEAGSQ